AWNRDLIAGEESQRGPDAMNRRAVIEILSEKQAQLFLGPAANGDDDVCPVAFLDETNQRVIANFIFVKRRDVKVLGSNRESGAAQPAGCRVDGSLSRQHPESFSGCAHHGQAQEYFQVGEARNAPDVATVKPSPGQ